MENAHESRIVFKNIPSTLKLRPRPDTFKIKYPAAHQITIRMHGTQARIVRTAREITLYAERLAARDPTYVFMLVRAEHQWINFVSTQFFKNKIFCCIVKTDCVYNLFRLIIIN